MSDDTTALAGIKVFGYSSGRDGFIEDGYFVDVPDEVVAAGVEHAATAGRRGAVKVAFDLRQERRR